MTNLYDRVKKDLETKAILRNSTDVSLKNLPMPSTIPNMSKAAKRILKAYEDKQKFLICGDYDVDGVNATALMVLAFKEAGLVLGEDFDWIVPDRFKDGYGVSKNMVDYAIKNGFSLIITVDNGIGAVEAVDYANENGVEVVITDHHTPLEKIPNASVIVDLKYKKGKFPMVDISGCTIAWFFQAQFKIEAERRSAKRKEACPINPINLANYTDLVGITVISDVMPLHGMNIGFYKSALRAIKNGKRLAYSLFFNEDKKKTLTEVNLSFGMIPAMNAVGRLSHAKHAVEMLINEDTAIVQREFEELEAINRKRKRLSQEQEEAITPEAERQIKDGKKAIIIFQENLHEGIVGILAGRLSKRFNVPAYVFGYNEKKGICKGSGRSAGVIDLFSLTKKAEKYALGFGGHVGAVGAGILKENFDKWSEVIWENAAKIPEGDFFLPNIKIFDFVWDEVDINLVNLLESYRPFGEGFEEPIFRITGKAVILNEMGTTGQHWKISLTDKNGKAKNISMFFTPEMPELDGKEITVEVKFALNSFGNNITIQHHGELIK